MTCISCSLGVDVAPIPKSDIFAVFTPYSAKGGKTALEGELGSSSDPSGHLFSDFSGFYKEKIQLIFGAHVQCDFMLTSAPHLMVQARSWTKSHEASRPKTLGQKAFCPEWLLVYNIYIFASTQIVVSEVLG
jgi:hypothetical protein